MREIKFRAWDKLQNKFLWPYPNGFHLFGEVTCFDLIEQQVREYVPEGHDSMLRINDVVIMQYTGLKDKNGKEIYEGDIVYFERNGGWKSICEYIENRAEFKFKIYDKISTYIGESFYKYFEIIGNIYENPELLKK